MWKIIGLIVVVLLIYGVLIPNPSTTSSPAAPSCASDWTKCTDNSDMVNNFRGWTGVQVDCKIKANDLAKYGTPEWPWLPFGSFYPGTNYKSGKVTAIEPKAKFQNGFGAMVHSQVICEYDLNAKRVIDVRISAR